MSGRVRLGSDAGDTLIEILAAIILIGIAVVFVMSGLAANAKTSLFNRVQAASTAALTAGAEYVVESLGWDNCNNNGSTSLTSTQVPQLNDLPSGTTMTVAAPSVIPSSATCNSDGTTSDDLEGRTVSIDVPGSPAWTDSLVAVVRCEPAFGGGCT
jgi:type II secretory pathway pseudopilin PulG